MVCTSSQRCNEKICAGIRVYTGSSELEMASLSTPCLYPGLFIVIQIMICSFTVDQINRTDFSLL